jgi:hypothetical protein
MEPRERLRPVVEDDLELALLDVRRGLILGHEADTDALARGDEHLVDAVDGDLSFDAHLDLAASGTRGRNMDGVAVASWHPRVKPPCTQQPQFAVAIGLLVLVELGAGCSGRNETGARAEPPVAVEPPHADARTVDAAVASGTIEVLALGTGTRFRFKGLAIDRQRERAFLGSWDQKQLVVVDLGTRVHRVVPTRYSGKLNGMGAHLRDDKLYFVMNEVDDRPRARALSVLLVIDAVTLEVVRSYELRAAGARHHFNHVVVDDRGIAYVSDTLHASIHTVDTRRADDSLRVLVHHRDLTMVHGLALSATRATLIATSYQSGVVFIDVDRKVLRPSRAPSTAGDDGLAYHAGALYGIGGNALKRYTLSTAEDAIVGTDVLIRDHPVFNDPRCLDIRDGWLYALANIELEPATFAGGSRGAALDDSHLVRYRL